VGRSGTLVDQVKFTGSLGFRTTIRSVNHAQKLRLVTGANSLDPVLCLLPRWISILIIGPDQTRKRGVSMSINNAIRRTLVLILNNALSVAARTSLPLCG
jgi:hypothetical protein